ncbi:mechanosensitive ion channel protein MscS [Ornithobacterium rhinotracheale]|uniref:mechanosensitive ion channel family protein n=1 Tax=Ornithobacterium rhinotracheale TaxID=28251 RepID=UPI00129C650B|nr:mechanosensitive ion channel domain-containing protein [Ornithobacterium rhinotracheale]MRI64674.1 mechanosensitive ion channel protein MscS [Ornithobacterium rhinotracheale]
MKDVNLDLTKIDIHWLASRSIVWGLKIIIGILILIIGFWVSSKISVLIVKFLSKSRLSVSIRNFLKSLVSVLLKILTIIIAMNTVGIQTTSLAALLGGLAVGVGLALQGSLANLAGGLLILFFKPFKVGDYIEALGQKGTVQVIDILQTVLLAPNGQTIILPNGNVFNNPIINLTQSGYRRVEIGIGVSYDSEFEHVKAVLTEVIKNEPLLIEDRGYVIEINEFGDNSVNLAMYCYCKAEDFMTVKWNLNRATKKALDANGIGIPYPQRDLHLIMPENNQLSIKNS